MPELGVNIDHVATVRQARMTNEPDPVRAAVLSELGGADGITLHLREDRRHIQDRDLRVLKEIVQVKLNLELAAEEKVVEIAAEIQPDQATLVPEKREEITTEGGLDLFSNQDRIQQSIEKLNASGILVSLFIDPDEKQIMEAKTLGVPAVELHTGRYADANSQADQQKEYQVLCEAAQCVQSAGMTLHLGHGLTYRNVRKVAMIEGVHELNIGHSIVARALMVGFTEAVREMKRLVTFSHE